LAGALIYKLYCY